MNKYCKYYIAFTIIVSVFLLAILRKLTSIENVVSYNLKRMEAFDVLEEYDSNDVNMIIVGNFRYGITYCFLTEKEDPEYFAKFIDMFWGENADYVEMDTPYIGGLTVTFVNSLGEMITFYANGYGKDVNYGGVNERGIHFSLESWDCTVARDMLTEVFEKRWPKPE